MGAHLRFGRGVIDPSNSALHQSSSAHRAGLKRDHHLEIFHPPAPEPLTGLFQSQEFGMGGGVLQRVTEVGCRGDDLITLKQHGAHRDIAESRCLACFCHSALHRSRNRVHYHIPKEEGQPHMRGTAQPYHRAVTKLNTLERIRTFNLRFRRPMLYPVELPVHLVVPLRGRSLVRLPRWGVNLKNSKKHILGRGASSGGPDNAEPPGSSTETQGFEPWIEQLALYAISSRAPSAARPCLHRGDVL